MSRGLQGLLGGGQVSGGGQLNKVLHGLWQPAPEPCLPLRGQPVLSQQGLWRLSTPFSHRWVMGNWG